MIQNLVGQHHARCADHEQLFLDMQGRTPSHKDYLPLSYRELLPFFEARLSKQPAPTVPERVVKMYVQHYAALLSNHLWIKRKTKFFLPQGLQDICERVGSRNRVEAGGLMGNVIDWQKSLGRDLEEFLYGEADRHLGRCFKFTWDIWFSFIPPELDNIPILTEGGADRELPGRMVLYQFFVIPFGDKASVRKPGIFIDVKLLPVKSGYEQIKQMLHNAALTYPVFNRVKNTVRLPKYDILLNHEICSFEEAVSCETAELRQRIANRIERFAKSIHPEIVSFFKKQAAAMKSSQR